MRKLKNIKSKVLNVFIVAVLSLSVPTICIGQDVFKAGASKFNITPPEKLLGDRIVHDSLYAKSIVLDNGIERIAFIIVDNQGIPQYVCDEARRIISITSDIPVKNIVIAATHTHSGEIAGNAPVNLNKDGKYTEYQIILINGIVESVKNANKNLIDAKIGWGSIDKPQYVFNRRWYMKSPVINPFGLKDSVKTNPGYNVHDELLKPAGPTDPEVFFIAIKSLTDEPIAILANYSLHYVGGVEKNNISADYFGKLGDELSILLQSKNNDIPFIGIMSNGTSGDINNENYSGERENVIPYGKINLIARDIAESIIERYKQIKFYNWIPINITYSSLKLKTRIPSSDILQNVNKINQNKSTKNLYNSQEKVYAGRVSRFTTLYPKEISIPLQAIQIGDVGISAVPFEIFAETGLELKKKNPFKSSFTIGLANGHWGYLPTPEQHKKGGYETWITVNRVQENASTIIVNQLLKQFRSLN